MRRLTNLLRPAVPLGTAVRLCRSYLDDNDTWHSLPVRSVDRLLGPGIRTDFRWYFEGESQVSVKGLDDVCEWLLSCEYVDDQQLFHQGDFWQHPKTFEAIMRGDCEDHAIWAWRKLCELGYGASFCGGHLASTEPKLSRHAWVTFRRDGLDYVLEATAAERTAMVRPLDQAKEHYCPHFSIDQEFSCHVHSGLIAFRVLQKSKPDGTPAAAPVIKSAG